MGASALCAAAGPPPFAFGAGAFGQPAAPAGAFRAQPAAATGAFGAAAAAAFGAAAPGRPSQTSASYSTYSYAN